ncbi:phosphotransferase [uncultured Friedmanniella sp.]|uniref:phosphotransferase n=1 Tax=uncultured Friedmanniella sp. TaxID=335381 RepID=UPI0035C9C62E
MRTSATPEVEDATTALGWAQQELPGAVSTWLRARPWAEVWSVTAPSGRWWLKANSVATGYEPRLLQLLADLGSPLIPAVRVHPDQPWSLVADAGRPAHEAVRRAADPVAALDFWCVLLARYAELQRAVPAEQLRGTGLPDASATALPTLLAELLSEPDWLAPALAPDLDDADRARIRGCGPKLREAAAALADGMPATLQHDDLHDANVFVSTPDLEPARAVVIDWGDASLSHPFGTLLVTLRALASAWGLAPEDPQLAQVRAAYLEVWRTGGESPAELDREVALALRTGPLVRAASWRRALGTPQAGLAWGMGAGTAHWLRRLADGLAVG